MNTTGTKKIIITATAAAICLGGPWFAAPAAQAKTITSGSTVAATPYEIDELVTMRKQQFAHDYVAYAAARAAYALR
jgi:hypothetical protein